ncbi:hypothetical protein C8R44DRAFT_886972 [Mycena epipterygia]|nr:hypothetical protein C8R44DRAFT_886972 [Mycena epipterygia]
MDHMRQLCIIELREPLHLFFRKLILPALRSLEYDAIESGSAFPFPAPPEAHGSTYTLVEEANEEAANDPLFALLAPNAHEPDTALSLCLQHVRLSHFLADAGHTLLAFIRARTGDPLEALMFNFGLVLQAIAIPRYPSLGSVDYHIGDPPRHNLQNAFPGRCYFLRRSCDTSIYLLLA